MSGFGASVSFGNNRISFERNNLGAIGQDFLANIRQNAQTTLAIQQQAHEIQQEVAMKAALQNVKNSAIMGAIGKI